jgi:predicted deacetylase
LSEAAQEAKLVAAHEIFSRERVNADLWVAPAHSFDATTIRLLHKMGMGVISDGFALRPYRELNMVWIPQQIWRFRWLPWGVWTVCLHHNRWGARDLELFRLWVEKIRDICTSVTDLMGKPVPSRGIADKSLEISMCAALKMKRWMRGDF